MIFSSLLLLIIAYDVTIGQYATHYGTSRAVEVDIRGIVIGDIRSETYHPDLDGVTAGASSLAFVFDITGSMWDDLKQVTAGAKQILETTLGRQEQPLHNYILVPFHDPQVGPVTVTTDPDHFEQSLRNLYIQGGGDCPEMSITAIREALLISLPGSFIYVFTDARSKDYLQLPEILKIIQRKQSQVVFVLTGDCENQTHDGYKAYERIAATSSGQVFFITKDDVSEVVKFIEVSVQAQKVVLHATDHSERGRHEWRLPFDPELQEITIAVSGPGRSLELYDPTGTLINEDNGMEILLNLDSVLIATIKAPSPGIWRVITNSSGEHSLRVTGLSTLDFQARFSRWPTLDWNNADFQPVSEMKTYALLNATGLISPGSLSSLRLVDSAGRVKKRIHLTESESQSSGHIYSVEPFISPDYPYYLVVHGVTHDGYRFVRASKNAIINVAAEKPKIDLDKDYPGYFDSTVDLVCDVYSLLPFDIKWSRYVDDHWVSLTDSKHFRESASDVYHIDDVTEESEGIYRCLANNSIGFDYGDTFLDVEERPPTIIPSGNVSVVPGGDVILTCNISSSVEYSVTWRRKDRKYMHPRRIIKQSNNSLLIKSARRQDEADYECVVTNSGGETVGSILLFVQIPPTVQIRPTSDTDFKNGDSIMMSCTASGYPTPTINWLKDSTYLYNVGNIRIKRRGRNFELVNARQTDEGIYSCQATSRAGVAVESVRWIYTARPVVTVEESDMLVLEGEQALIKCIVEGVPMPTITWYKSRVKVITSAEREITDEGLLIHQVSEFDQGDFQCFATNQAGIDRKSVHLTVGRLPFFTNPPHDIGVDIGRTVSLPCVADGSPKPKVDWIRVSSEDSTMSLSRSRTRGSSKELYITNLQLEDEGLYSCVASNQFGETSETIQLTVTGTSSPRIMSVDKEMNIIIGNSKVIGCRILSGTPTPNRQWYKNDIPIRTSSDRLRVNRNGNLVITNAKPSDSATYVCEATNEIGDDRITIDLDVWTPPRIHSTPSSRSTVEGFQITLPCKTSSNPPATYLWRHDTNEKIENDSERFLIDEDGSLILLNPRDADRGRYTCTANNPAGVDSITTSLEVYTRPQLDLDRAVTEYMVVMGNSVSLHCAMTSARPNPTYEWTHNGKTLSGEEEGILIRSDGVLYIKLASLFHSGIYECSASNIAGKTQHQMSLKVLQPPKIHRDQHHVAVLETETALLSCSASGFPSPTIEWFRDGLVIDADFDPRFEVTQEEGSSELRVTRSRNDDDGSYRCIATNIAGKDSKVIELDVQKFPEITGSVECAPVAEIDEPEICLLTPLEKHPFRVPCNATGDPKPRIRWYHEGRILEGDENIDIDSQGTLIFRSVDPEDNGVYTCLAENDLGDIRQVVEILVHEIPEIRDNDGKIEHVSVIEGEDTQLDCETFAVPPPVMSWFKGEAKELVEEDEHTRLSPSRQVLHVNRARVYQSGTYFCLAENEVGQNRKFFRLDVYVPASIEHGEAVDKHVTNVENPVSLYCRVRGVPFPNIRWFKGSSEISPANERITFKERKQVLHLDSAEVTDTSPYFCVANNIAGEDQKNFDLQIQVPPTIKGRDDVYMVMQFDRLRLQCLSSGVPDPEVEWRREGQQLPVRALFYNKQQTLEFESIHKEDEGMFECRASNDAGISYRRYEVVVRVPPRIRGLDSDQNETVIIGGTFKLTCDADGDPPPEISWIKDGIPLIESSNRVVSDDRKLLTVTNAQEADAGTYECIAHNDVGEEMMFFVVNVFVPARIESGNYPEVQVIEHSSVMLECLVYGKPFPQVTWKIHGEEVEETDRVSFHNRGQQLVISDTFVSDANRYTCDVTNAIGKTSYDTDLIVNVPPHIIQPTRNGEEYSVVEGGNIEMLCTSTGIPMPSLTWLKDESPVNTNLVSLSENNQVLSVDFADVINHEGSYKCIASNSVGEDFRTMSLVVNVPPMIERNTKEVEIVVEAGRSAILECRIEAGKPAPEILWFNGDNQPLDGGSGRLITNGRQRLHILSAQLSDAGRYWCDVTNIAGSSRKLFNLLVIVAPHIEGENEISKISIILGHDITLECQVRGFPTPDIIWFKNRVVLGENADLSAGGTRLTIHDVREDDAGSYRCLATNAAGNSTKELSLEVYMPPSSGNEEIENITVNENFAVTLKCDVRAFPPPTIQWFKNSRPVLLRPGVHISEDGHILSIESANERDTGLYFCEAVNIAGKKRKHFRLTVHVVPIISGLPKVNLEHVVGDDVRMDCGFDGIPSPVASWTGGRLDEEDHTGLVLSSDQRHLSISSVQLNDTGRYTCEARNEAGFDIKTFNLVVYQPPSIEGENNTNKIVVNQGDLFVLTCSYSGFPKPNILWLKNQRPLLESVDSAKLVEDSRKLVVVRADVDDSAKYKCVAGNNIGIAERRYYVEVRIPPKIKKEGLVDARWVNQGSNVSLSCDATGFPQPSVEWRVNGLPLQFTPRIRLSSAGRILKIFDILDEDAATYTCIATNFAGVDSRDVTIDVFSSPTIEGSDVIDIIDVNIGESFMLECTAEGFPTPIIEWLKNGLVIASTSEYQLLDLVGYNLSPNGRFLSVTSSNLNHMSDYSCQAVNTAGNSGKKFRVNIRVPPSIDREKSSPVDITTYVNTPTTIRCSAHGSPTPAVSWLKDGEPIEITDSSKYKVQYSNRHLKIKSTLLRDEGVYTCITSNPAGDASLDFNLHVQVPPRIEGSDHLSPSLIEVRASDTITLYCLLEEGNPTPDFIWTKGRMRIIQNERIRISEDGQALTIDNSKSQDTGRYRCTAINEAGEDDKAFDLEVQNAPNFPTGDQVDEIEVNEGAPFHINCKIVAVPQPQLNWLKDEELIESNDHVIIYPDGRTIQVLSARASDAGNYDCVARNKVGSDSKRVHVRVNIPPRVADNSRIEIIRQVLGTSFELQCDVTGSPTPTITWYKNAIPIDVSSPKYKTSNNNQNLLIKEAELTDSGLYDCRAKNTAGQDNKAIRVQIQVRPDIYGPDTTKRVAFLNTPVVLSCDADGVPSPSLHWQKDEEIITPQTNPRYQLIAKGRFLMILAIKRQDDGIYTCIARNEAGEDRKNVHVVTYVSPTLPSTSGDIVVDLGQSATLSCINDAKPLPNVLWRRDGEVLQIDTNEVEGVYLSHNRQVLTIDEAMESDAGRYACVVSNKAGIQTKNFKLSVNVPPSIDGPQQVFLTTILGDSTALECKVYAVPTAEVQWMKDGSILTPNDHINILSDNTKLQIASTHLTDRGSYTCFASNPAGSAEKNVDLTILVPPQIVASDTNVDVVEDEDILLKCEVTGHPQPQMEWLINGLLVDAEEIDQWLLSNNDQFLSILNVQVGEGGKVVCRARNVAGVDSHSFNIRVLVPPVKIDNGDAETDVIAGLPITLECNIQGGFPLPQITWFKNSLPLELSDRLQVFNEGKTLRISQTQESDTGIYSCVATNDAGEVTDKTKLNVHVPPTFTSSNIVTSLTVMKGENFELDCSVYGVPQPDIAWSKDSQPLTLPTLRHKTVANNQKLRVTEAEVVDTGRYTCLAISIAGKNSKNFDVDVYDEVRIEDQHETHHISVNVGESLDLSCIAYGVPTPQISWLKNGDDLIIDSQRVFENGRRFSIQQATLSDSGTYVCVATSASGTAEKSYDITVNLPPSIDDFYDDVLAVVGDNVTLLCPSNAVPPPVLSWYRYATEIDNNDNKLELFDVQLEDSGIYTCIASNIAGSVSQDINLNVLSPPRIKEGREYIVVNENDYVKIDCIVSGKPTPNVLWRHGGRLLKRNNKRYIFESNGLIILRVFVEDAGNYYCLAANNAGSDKKITQLVVQVPPTIKSGATNVTVVVNNPITLGCESEGLPKPTVVWSKDSVLLKTDSDPTYNLLDSGSLRIPSVLTSDAATYRCTASNDAGSSDREITLNVQVPPSITGGPNKYVKKPGSYLRIPCIASGIPQPTVSWLKDGQPATRDEGIEVDSSGNLIIESVILSHDGTYICVAQNHAGTAKYQTALEVRMVPKILTESLHEIVEVGESLQLPCEATGIPKPTIIWRKGPNKIISSNSSDIFDDGTLHLINIKSTDSGLYTCVAQNLAGIDSNEAEVEVYITPWLKTDLPDQVIAVAGEPLTIKVEVEGHPPPLIKWSRGNEVMESEGGNIQIPIVSVDHAGVYAMTAANDAGSIIHHVRVIIHSAPYIEAHGPSHIIISEGETFTLSVDVQGLPRPSVRWYKQNREVDVTSDRVHLLPDGSLKVQDATKLDSGHFLIEAVNIAGRSTREFELTVQVAPIITTAPRDSHVRDGEYVVMTCTASGFPLPSITWRFTENLVTGGRIRIEKMPGRSRLSIDHARSKDAGMYTCEAENPAGKRMAVAFVTVDRPPQFVDGTSDQRVVRVGEDAMLHCVVRADPRPIITWTKDGKEVSLGERMRVFENGSLALFDTIRDDSGNYKCVATNTVGSAERIFKLTLQMAPRWLIRPTDVSVDAGDTFVLDCTAVAEPQPIIAWFKQGEPLVYDDRVTLLRNNSLHVTASRLGDTDSYFCIVSNFLGAINHEAKVVVRVNGGFTSWSPWGSCSSSCGDGFQLRMRFCINPAPANGGVPCPGEPEEQRRCEQANCPIDGGWGSWGPWEECSQTCGRGVKTRLRDCNNPSPQFGGLSCDGEASESAECIDTECAIDGHWTEWGEWSACGATCGESLQTRRRACSNPAPSGGGIECFGSETATKVCSLRSCPVNGNWAAWSSWGICSASCGGGTRNRARTCSDPVPQNGGQLCSGSNQQIDNCNIEPCSVNGNWGSWGSWSECSRTCSGGQMNRYRSCSDPPPRFGGRFCPGSDSEMRGCGLVQCPVDGGWSEWSSWSECSVTCGSGERVRQRQCSNPVPRFGGSKCHGDGNQAERCLVTNCQGTPDHATGILFGTINNTPFGGSPIIANGTKIEDKKTRIFATIKSVPPSVGAYLKSQVSILTPIYWTIARELDGAYNGYSLTKGFFNRDVMVEFPTGEIVRMEHKCRGVDNEGRLIIHSDVKGNVPDVDLGTQIDIKDYTEDYIQTGPGSIYAFSDRLISLDTFIMPYTWNHSISYNSSLGKMPFLVEILYARNIQVNYDLRLQQLHFNLDVSIGPGEFRDTCPYGFILDPTGQYCNDEDECEMWNPCSHDCVNVPGSFICNCPLGYTVSTDGRSCDDLDECLTEQYVCGPALECLNTLGSYKCVVTCEPGMKRADDGITCQDIDECEEATERICDHTCTNTLGSYRCECRSGYRKLYNGKCRDINECRRNVCRKDQRCRNTQGGYRCIDDCPPGMRKNSLAVCVDTNECVTGLHDCGEGMICENTPGGYNCICPPGFKGSKVDDSCVDINECELKPPLCEYNCNNTKGSYNCICPVGYRLSKNGHNCRDINECREGIQRCPKNRMCFNQRGTSTCIDTPCPPTYTRAESGHCVRRCTGPNCNGQPRYAIEYKTIALPYGITPFQDLVRLSVYSDSEELHMNTRFSVRNTYGGPFNIRNEHHKGVLFTTAGELQKSRTYHIEAQATSYSSDNSHVEYYTKFIIYINVGSFYF